LVDLSIQEHPGQCATCHDPLTELTATHIGRKKAVRGQRSMALSASASILLFSFMCSPNIYFRRWEWELAVMRGDDLADGTYYPSEEDY